MLRAARWPRQPVRHGSRRGLASVSPVSSTLPRPGDTLHGFKLERVKHVPEFELTAFDFSHTKTGAQYLHVARDDSNNVFSIGFKTNPPDDTGVPHILEHVTLCGSDKYPIRDPFFKMLPRTLSNFMNAFTSADHTTYPFATTNKQDFRNLMSVYLDATLHPLLKKDDFFQEGWRIGPENPQDSADKLVFKGVVYNEMKGQMSDANYLYYIRFQDHIFPAIHNSGGDPKKITDLTHEKLKAFHAKNYHPSNSKIFTYGDFPFEEHLAQLGEQLSLFSAISPDVDAKLPISLDGPQVFTVDGPTDPLLPADMQYKTSVTWLTGDTGDAVENFGLQILASLLTSGYSSPLYRGLIEAGLGAEWSPNTGFDNSARIGMFSIGLSGVKEENVGRVEEAIKATLERCKQDGFENTKIDGILHRLEVSLKHKTAQFGLGLMQRLTPGWFNGVDPFTQLEVDKLVNEFKKLYAEGNYLEHLLEKYFLNDKALTFTMSPSTEYATHLVAEESARLNERIDKLKQLDNNADKAVQQLRQREADLLEVQEKAKTQPLDCLPSVQISDVPRRGDIKSVRSTKTGDVTTQWREAPTNGLTYFRAISPLSKPLPSELRVLLPLFSDAVFRLGTKNMTTEQLEDAIKLKTGGISLGYHIGSSSITLGQAVEGIAFTGYALDRHVPDMYELLRIVIAETDFDSPDTPIRLRQLLQSDASGAINSVAEMGHSFARKYANASLNLEGRYSEEYSGLTQVRSVASLAARPDTDQLADVITKLKTIQQLVAAENKNMRAAITCGFESVTDNEAHLAKFLSQTFSGSTAPDSESTAPSTPLQQQNTFFNLPYQVYYTSKSLPTVPYTSTDSAPLQILAQILTHRFLHHEIREKGGAYGGGATSSPLSGTFSFYSYRDPNPVRSLSTYASARDWLLNSAAGQAISDKDLDEAKLLVFQGVDAPKSVSEEGMSTFLTGVTEEQRQQRRERLLDVTAAQVRDVAERLLDVANKGVGVIIGKEHTDSGLEKAFKDWSKGDLGVVQEEVAQVVEA